MATPYASLEQFKAHLGALRLSGMTNVEEASEDAFFADLLLAGSGEIDSVAASAGYAVPLDLDTIVSLDLRAKLEALLAVTTTTLAAWSMVGGMAGASEGLKLAYDKASAWLKSIRKGEAELLGLTKTGKSARVAGRVGVVLGDDDLDRLMNKVDRFNRQTLYG